MELAGARLKKLRLEKGISLEEAHKKTKVHLNILKAIEEDGLINFDPVYIRGFLKIYCKFLGVSPRDYIVDYKEPQSQSALLSGSKLAKNIEIKPVSFMKSASIKLGSLRPHIKIKPFIIILTLILVSIGLFNLGKIISGKRVTNPKKSRAVASVSKPKKPEVAPQEVITGIRVGIRAKEDCWIQLKADGRLIFQNILKRGRFESWQAKDKIELSLGNAGVVDLEVNGKIIPTLGRRGQALKNILITKQGLVSLR